MSRRAKRLRSQDRLQPRPSARGHRDPHTTGLIVLATLFGLLAAALAGRSMMHGGRGWFIAALASWPALLFGGAFALELHLRNRAAAQGGAPPPRRQSFYDRRKRRQ